MAKLIAPHSTYAFIICTLFVELTAGLGTGLGYSAWDTFLVGLEALQNPDVKASVCDQRMEIVLIYLLHPPHK